MSKIEKLNISHHYHTDLDNLNAFFNTMLKYLPSQLQHMDQDKQLGLFIRDFIVAVKQPKIKLHLIKKKEGQAHKWNCTKRTSYLQNLYLQKKGSLMPCHMDATTSHPEVEFDHSLPDNWKLS